MKETVVIKRNYEFKNLFSKGKFYYGEFIHFYIKKNNLPYNKFGIAVSRKQGKAVYRNRIKRLIRENYSLLIIINKNKNIKEITYYDIESNFLKTLKKANLLVE